MSAVSRLALALALAFEHARILQEPSTYHWMIRRQGAAPPHGTWVFDVFSGLERAVANAIGAELWCALALMLSTVLVCGHTPQLRLSAITALLVMRLVWLAVHEGNSIQPSDSYVIWNIILVGSFDVPRLLDSARFGTAAAAGVAYLFSGMLKLASPSWRAGHAVGLLSSGFTARALLRRAPVAAAVRAASPAITWGAIVLELSFAPLLLCGPRARRLALFLSVCMHVGTLAFIDVPWISFYMFSHHIAMLAGDRISSDRISRLRPPLPTHPRWHAVMRCSGLAVLLSVIGSASILALSDGSGLVHSARLTGISPLIITGTRSVSLTHRPRGPSA